MTAEAAPDGSTVATDVTAAPAATVGSDHEDPYTGAVEIRIHGVSGTPPEGLLDRTSVRQVAGDTIAGFYRPRLQEGLRDHAPGTDWKRGPWLEAYSWGGWTSGGRTRAFWLALFPFAMVNVSQRMLPPSKPLTELDLSPRPAAEGDEKKYRWQETLKPGVGLLHRMIGGLIRYLALSLTVTFMAGVAQLGVVVIGQRCGTPDSGCVGLPDAVVGWLRGLPAGVRLAVGTLVPILVLVGLWLMSDRTTKRYEDIAPEPDPQTDVRPDDSLMPLGRRDLWRGSRRVRRLRLIHVHAGSATIVLVLAAALPASAWSKVLIWLGAGWVLFNVALAVFRPANNAAHPMRLPRFNWGIVGISAILVVLALILVDPAALDADRAVEDIDWMLRGWWSGQFIAMIAVGVLLLFLRGRAGVSADRWHLRGFGAFFFAALGWLVGLLFNAALLILVPTWLFTDGLVFGPGAVSDFLAGHKAWFGQSVYAAGYGVLVSFVLLLCILIGYGISAATRWAKGWTVDADVRAEQLNAASQPRIERLGPEESDVDRQAREEERKKQIRFVFWVARRVDYAALMIGLLVLGTFVFMILQVIGQWQTKGFLSRIAGHVGTAESGDKPTVVAAWGAYLVAAVLVLAIGVALASYRRPATRRGVGVIWDLACFWPRDVHPFAPPCYTERIVPEFSRRLAAYVPPDWTVSSPTKSVVIAAHSQGTVISMAVLLAQPPTFRADRVGLLTCGTVLDRLYARFFPRYFSPMAFSALVDVLGAPDAGRGPGPSEADRAADGDDPVSNDAGTRTRWINLWRFSDYLGGSVPYTAARRRGECGDQTPEQLPPWATLENRFLADPNVDRGVGAIMPAPPGRHSNYWRDPQFQAAAGLLAEMVDPKLASAAPQTPGPDDFPSAPTTIR